MYLLLTDETNTRPSADAKFFIYGGLLFPIDRLVDLDRDIAQIRAELGYRPGDELKFDTRARPQHVSMEASKEAKRRVVEACLKYDCKFIAHIILHDIIKNQDQDQQVQWAADYVLGRYNYFLRTVNSFGICVVDNLPVKAQWKYLSSKFCHGLVLPRKNVPLDRIKLFAATCLNASHANSAMDIVLGSFRFCINNPRNKDVARSMIKNVVQVMWHEREGNDYNVGGRGLIVRPANTAVEKHREEYKQFFACINELLDEKTEQK